MMCKALIDDPKILLVVRNFIRGSAHRVNDLMYDFFQRISAISRVSLQTLFEKVEHDFSMGNVLSETRLAKFILSLDEIP